MDNNKDFRQRKATRTTVIIGVIVLIALIVVGVWQYVQSKLDKINYVPPSESQTEQDQPEKVLTDIGGQKYFNILLLGTDERSDQFNEDARSDSTMLLSLNLKSHAAHLVSLERGIGVPIPDHEDDWLTHAFRYGGADLMLDTVSKQFDVEVDRYVRVNFYAFAQIIDAIGGVDITLTNVEAQALNGEIYTNATTKHRVYPGLNHLDGYDALQYARQRFIDDDWHRVARQRTVLQAAVEQTKHINLMQINKLLDEVLPLVQTNLTKKEINSLLPSAPFFLGVKLEQMTLPLHGTFGNKLTSDGRSLMMLDFEENAKILNQFIYDKFDPETYEVPDDVTERIIVAQQKAYQQWLLAHPQPPAKEEITEDDEDDTVLEPKRSIKRTTDSSSTSSSQRKSTRSTKSTTKDDEEDTELANLQKALHQKMEESSSRKTDESS